MVASFNAVVASFTASKLVDNNSSQLNIVCVGNVYSSGEINSIKFVSSLNSSGLLGYDYDTPNSIGIITFNGTINIDGNTQILYKKLR